MDDLYEMIFKRKSFRRFNKELSISGAELEMIQRKISELTPLIKEINIDTKIVPKEETSCRRGQYCILVYSQVAPNYLLNVGYLFEQLDLFLASIDIGVCWYGLGKEVKKEDPDDQNYIIMLNIGKSSPSEFRKDYTKSKRKDTTAIWNGEYHLPTAEVAKYAPSACNSQPWRVVARKDKIEIYRSTKVKSIIPKEKIDFYNTMDMGIFLCFIELALKKSGIVFHRDLYNEWERVDLMPIATYKLETI